MALDFYEKKTLENGTDIEFLNSQMTTANTDITDLAGVGRTTETVKGNADDISDLAGVGRTTETVKANADDIADIKAINGIIKGDGAGAYSAAVAADVAITDSGTYFDDDDVESALQEVGASLAEITQLQTQNANKVSRVNVFACIGDSITLGYLGYPYPSFLMHEEGITVQTYAVGGYTIQDVIDTLVPQVLAATVHASHAILLTGINDIFEGVTPANMKLAYKELCETLVGESVTPIICALIPQTASAAQILPFNEWLRNYANANGFIFVDTNTPFYAANGTLNANYFQADGTHPTTLGYYAIYIAVLAKLPIVETDYPWFPVGGENLITNPYFITDGNEDGFGDDWAKVEVNASAVYSLTDHPIKGKWQQVVYTGTATSSFIWVQKESISTGFAAGDVLEFSVDIDGVDGLSKDVRLRPMVFFDAPGDNILDTLYVIEGGTNLKDLPLSTDPAGMVLPFAWKRFKATRTVPVGCTYIVIGLSIQGSGTSTVRWGRVLLKHATAV